MKSQMDTTAILIIAILVLAIGILFFMKLGFLDQILELVAVPFNSIMSMLRGIIINNMWNLGKSLFVVATIMVWTSSKCWNPAGAVVCGSINTHALLMISTLIVSFFAAIILVHIPTAPIHLGKIDSNGHIHTVPKEKIMKRVADSVVECFQMYGADKYNPLAGIDPPNPADCFQMNIVPNESFAITSDNLYTWMANHEYPTGIKCDSIKHPCDITYISKMEYLAGNNVGKSYKEYVSTFYIPLVRNQPKNLFVKYYDKYNYNYKAIVTSSVSSKCYDIDCGYSEDSCDGFTHDMVVLCG